MLRRLIADVFALIGAIVAIAGLLLPLAQYFSWLWTDVWHPINIRTVFDAISVSTPQTLNAMLEWPLWITMFTVGLLVIWIAAELYEWHARSLTARHRTGNHSASDIL